MQLPIRIDNPILRIVMQYTPTTSKLINIPQRILTISRQLILQQKQSIQPKMVRNVRVTEFFDSCIFYRNWPTQTQTKRIEQIIENKQVLRMSNCRSNIHIDNPFQQTCSFKDLNVSSFMSLLATMVRFLNHGILYLQKYKRYITNGSHGSTISTKSLSWLEIAHCWYTLRCSIILDELWTAGHFQHCEWVMIEGSIPSSDCNQLKSISSSCILQFWAYLHIWPTSNWWYHKSGIHSV